MKGGVIEHKTEPETELICKFCKTIIPADRIYGSTAICQKCGQANIQKKIANPWLRWGLITLLLLALAGMLFYSRHTVMISLNPKLAVKSANFMQLQKIQQRCLERSDHECLISVYQKRIISDPQDMSSRANLAFQLTTLKRFGEADPIYKNVLASGVGTYDLMAYYAVNLAGLEQLLEAIKWFEKCLGVNPNLADVTQKLASLYAQVKRPAEAVSLLQSFIYRFPSAEGLLKGDLSADLELFEKSEPTEELRLVGLSEGHFGVPLQFGASKHSEMFMVDTGASIVSLPTSDIEKYWPNLLRKNRRAQVAIANGQRLDVQLITIPSIKIGAWEFRNIEAAFCDSCVRLAGMSLMKNLRMQTASQGELSTLTLSR